jgi:hypothetical protein
MHLRAVYKVVWIRLVMDHEGEYSRLYCHTGSLYFPSTSRGGIFLYLLTSRWALGLLWVVDYEALPPGQFQS